MVDKQLKAVYVGADIDVEPLKLEGITEFFFLDIQPDISYFARDFINELVAAMSSSGCELIVKEDNKLIFDSKKFTVTYFINTNIPKDIPKIKPLIGHYDILIVKGFDPHYSIVWNDDITFVGFKGTCYFREISLDEINNVTQKLHNNSEFRKRFKRFIYVKDDKSKIISKSWEQFMLNTPPSLEELWDNESITGFIKRQSIYAGFNFLERIFNLMELFKLRASI